MRSFLITALMAVAATSLVSCQDITPEYRAVEDQVKIDIPADRLDRMDLFETYKLLPGDVLDVLFQIRTWDDGQSEFKISVDDQVAIKFVNAPELDVDQTVRPDGRISLPYLGQISVAGRTIDEIERDLKKSFGRILWNPDLYIVVSNFRTRILELKHDLHTASRGLSRLVSVRPDGYVTFPMIGHVFVAGRTLPDVNEDINGRYGAYLEGLHVDLFLEKHAGSVVYVLGEVNNPGAFDVRRPLTVPEAITLAKGYTSRAKLTEAMVIRREGGTMVATRIDLERSLRLESPPFVLRPDDVVLLPRTRLSQAAEVMQLVGDVLLFRGWGVTFGWDIKNDPIID